KTFLDEFDFVQITVFYINMLQHFFWRDQPVLEGWRRIDNHLGDLMNRGCRIALLSDHGCGRIERVFNINAWLMEMGYLHLKRDDLRDHMPVGLKRLLSIMRRDKVLRNLVSKWVPKGLIRKIGLFQDELRGTLKFQMIDWDRTVAFASGQGPLYLNPGSSRYHKGLQDELAEALSGIRDPQGGLAPIRKVYRREQIYTGDYTHLGPDLVAEQSEGYYINGRVGRSAFFENPDRWKAENRREGIFLLYGEGIEPGHKEETRIVDIAPTLLQWHGVPVPSDMDGSVLSRFFSYPALDHAQTALPLVDTREHSENLDADEEIIRRQLINLGYME
ncbi:MAG: alkaline phosphatase family protein, partial [Desulfobacterales bacterium]|nr:alkaline phosphatase family protein [Desulfobacterales bacterium]